MSLFREWHRARRRAKRVRWLRNRAAELGVSPWGWSDAEVATSMTIACLVMASQAREIAAAMKTLTPAIPKAAQAMQDFAAAFNAPLTSP